MPGPLGTPCNTPMIDAGTMVRTESKAPGPVGLIGNSTQVGTSTQVRFVILLDLDELITIEQPVKGSVPDADTGYPRDVFVKAGVIQTDPDRPKKVLAKVQELFAALGDVMRIELYTPGGKWDRLLKAQFGHALVNTAGKPQISKRHGQFYDPVYVGAGATGIARTRIETFKPEKGDESEGPTAYVFEGAIGLVIMDYFDGKANVDNIFAVAIAHELGHNLGLAHTTSTADIMFVYANRYEDEQKAWMTGASNNKLRFTAAQVSQIRALLAKT